MDIKFVRFRSSWGWIQTRLRQELKRLGATNVIIEAEFDGDGLPYSNSTPTTGAVILSFKVGENTRSFPCKTFRRMEDNLYAIAMTLEALRKIDRYGVTSGNQQYTGFAALPPPAMRLDDAIVTIAKWSGLSMNDVRLDSRKAIREAQRKTHPDSPDGNAEAFKDVTNAKSVIEQLGL